MIPFIEGIKYYGSNDLDQGGGLIFGLDGIVYGIQSMTFHLNLNFDVNKTVKRGIENKKLNLEVIFFKLILAQSFLSV